MKQLGDDYCGPGCIGLCPCPIPPWKWHKKRPSKVVDPQQRWNVIGSFRTMKCGWAYVNSYDKPKKTKQ